MSGITITEFDVFQNFLSENPNPWLVLMVQSAPEDSDLKKWFNLLDPFTEEDEESNSIIVLTSPLLFFGKG